MSSKHAGRIFDLANQIDQFETIYLYEAKFHAALKLLNDEILDLLKSEEKIEEWIRLQHLRARIMRFKGYCKYDAVLYDEAINIMLDVISVVENLGDKTMLANTIDLTDSLLQSKEGSLDSSFETRLGYFERALRIRKEIGDKRGIAESYFHIGLAYQNKYPASEDTIQQAYEAFQKSYALAVEDGFAFEKAHAARHLAYMYDKRNEPDIAFKLHQEFLDTNQTIGFKPYLSPAHLMVGLAHFKQGELAEAEQHCQTAYESANKIGSNHFLADAAMMLGVITGAHGDNERAKKYLNEAISLAEPINLTRVMYVANRELEKLSSEG